MTSSHHLSLVIALVLGLSSVATPAEATYDVPASAYGEGAIHAGDAAVESRLIVDAAQVAPGDTVTVGVAFRLDPQWHIYWQNPGDAGVPTDIGWEGQGVEFGPLQWASPEPFTEQDDLTVFGYGGDVVLFSRATVSEDATGYVELVAQVDYLACSDACVPGHSRLTRTLPVGQTTVPADAAIVEALAASGERVPRKAADLGWTQRVTYNQTPVRPGDSFRVAVELIGCESLADCQALEPMHAASGHAFIPDRHAVPGLQVVDVAPHPEAAVGWVVTLAGELAAGAEPDRALLTGVVELIDARGQRVPVYVRDEIPIGAMGEPVEEHVLIGATVASASPPEPASPASPAETSLWWTLLMALVGGMILNLMPCVFPVLALKVSSLASVAHEARRHRLAHAGAYTGGIVGSLLVLGGVVVGLKLAGTEVGWGFQFQSPLYLVALTVLVVVFALNLFGVFEVGVQANALHDKANEAQGWRRSVLEGVLAVVLATPCSAPFLGTAVGFALASSWWVILAVFAALGLGLAAPFVVLTLVPGLARAMPRPGPWMAHLKHVLGFALLGTGVWLVWLLGRQAGVDAQARVLGMLLAVALAAWLYGRVQFASASVKKALALVIAAVVVGAGAWLALPVEATQRSTAPDRAEAGGLDWQPWTEHAVDEALAAGRPAFVDFTADWCLTCKVNEANAIDTAAVRALVAREDIAVFKADWTNPDERIRRKLAAFGRGGVPMYLVYSPARPDDPKLLPETITEDVVVTALEGAAEAKD